MAETYFDGTSFESMGIVVERVHDELPEMRAEMQEYPGRHGSHVSSLTLAPREIRLECRVLEDTWDDYDALMDELAGWLVTKDERPLILRNHPDQRYLAHYSSFSEGERVGGTGIGGFELTFTASDPLRYGEDRVHVVSGSTAQTFDVGGTDTPDMRIVVANARPSDGVLTLTINDTDLSVAITGTSRIELDCVSHRVLVNNNASGVTLDSVWPDFAPGRWTVKIKAGTGTATLSWTQRYR